MSHVSQDPRGSFLFRRNAGLSLDTGRAVFLAFYVPTGFTGQKVYTHKSLIYWKFRRDQIMMSMSLRYCTIPLHTSWFTVGTSATIFLLSISSEKAVFGAKRVLFYISSMSVFSGVYSSAKQSWSFRGVPFKRVCGKKGRKNEKKHVY